MLRPFATLRPVGSRHASRLLTVLLAAFVMAVLAALALPRPAAPSLGSRARPGLAAPLLALP